MNSAILHYAFIDESGTVGAEKGTNFFAAAILSVNQPRVLELPVRRALKKYGRLSSGELKASNVEKSATLRILNEIAKQDVNIIAVIVDQTVIGQPPDHAEEIYKKAATLAIYRLVEKFPAVHISLDRRYTKVNLRDELEQYIREGIQNLQHTVVLIRQESSYIHKELQAVDAIAWAFFQKYERGNSRFFDIIAAKVMVEEVIIKKNWKNG
ncbi:MAG: DUF3800 domain-containing protein [Chloroflexi bacterium]|nr:DUF3800 domain-containing protein [Chloroflexota bacterium]